jgi:ADP-heptose:LPS heptosyltransferase
METLSEPDGRPELLALRALKLGDLLVAVPALHALRRSRPDHRLILAAPGWLGPIAALVPGLDAHLPVPGLDDPLPLAPGRIDTVVNLHGSGPESRDLLDALQPQHRIGHRAPGWPGPDWVDDIHERVRWVRLVRAHGMPADPDEVAIDRPDRPSPCPGAVVVHVGAFYGSREWPADRFAATAAALAERGRPVVFTGGAADRPRAEQAAERSGQPAHTVLAGALDLTDFAALIADAALLVSADTGAAHLASAYGIPSVVIFGPAAPEHWGPPADGPHVVLTDARVRRGEPFAAGPDPALLAVTSEQVVDAARALLSPLSRAGGRCSRPS